MPWQIGKPYALPWGGWEKFDAEQKAKYPVRWFLFDQIPEKIGHVIYRWKRRYWAVMHRFVPRYKYHIIRTTLEPGYYDPDTRILYSVMDMVKEFVEGTKDTIAWDGDEQHSTAWEELQIIYKWWTDKYPNRDKELPDFPDVDFAKVLSEEHNDDPDVK